MSAPQLLHHVAIEAADFEASLRFYTDGLGLREHLRFEEQGHMVALLAAGGGTYVELFSPTDAGPHDDGGTVPTGPALFHFALRVPDCDAATERALAHGGTAVERPTAFAFAADAPARYSFVRGPSGEHVELIETAV